MTTASIRDVLQTRGVDLTLGIRRLASVKSVASLKSLLDLERVSLPYRYVPGFLPSTSALHFSNSYPSNTNYPFITLPVIGTIVSGDAGNGLCGGFAYTVLDMFLHQPRVQPPADTLKPDPGTPRFNYLVDRLIDSFGESRGFDNVIKAIDWIQTSSHDVLVSGSFAPYGLAHRMVYDEWPQIKNDIDSGRPSPLFLVMAPGCGPLDIPGITVALGNCHQVLAYAYTLDGDNLTIYIYDCNAPTNDLATLSLNISDPSHTIAVGMNTATGVTVRGFFRSNYSYRDPQPFL